MGIHIGPMNVRLENIHTQASPANYVSFLSQSQRSRGRSDHESIHSVSSVASYVSGMSALFSGFAFGPAASAAKIEKANAQSLADLKYLYSAFTKIPCLRLSLDHKARLVSGYEEFPFDTAVSLLAFKNISALEICDVDFRQFYGWDTLAEQLRSLTVKRSHLEDPADLLINVVLDDMDKRRRRSSKAQSSPMLAWPASPSPRTDDLARSSSSPSSPILANSHGYNASPRNSLSFLPEHESPIRQQRLPLKSASPNRLRERQQQESQRRHMRAIPIKTRRSGSGSSNSSADSSGFPRSGSASNLLMSGVLPASKWRFLRHLSLRDNSLTSLGSASLAPVSSTLQALDLSSNLFGEIPDCLQNLTALRALDVSNCMIDSLRSVNRYPMPTIISLNLRSNRLLSIAGIESLHSLQRLDLRENSLQDPKELARLTSIAGIRDIWVQRNAFVKKYRDYRITIFNLFRDTPGYSEDITLDSSPPGYSERRQLNDRAVAPDKDTLPISEGSGFLGSISGSTLIDQPPGSATNTAALDGQASLMTEIQQDDRAVAYNNRRKGPRRRIVDLAATDEGQLMTQDRSTPVESLQPEHRLQTATWKTQECPLPLQANSKSLTRGQETLPSSHSEQSRAERPIPEISDKGRFLATEIQTSKLDGEAYRQRVEALKREVGSNCMYSPFDLINSVLGMILSDVPCYIASAHWIF